MQKRSPRKLILRRDTLRRIDPVGLREIGGGLVSNNDTVYHTVQPTNNDTVYHPPPDSAYCGPVLA